MAPALLGRIAKAIEVLANQGTRVAKVRAPHWLRIMRAFTSVPLNANLGPSQNRGRADKKIKPGRGEDCPFLSLRLLLGEG